MNSVVKTHLKKFLIMLRYLFNVRKITALRITDSFNFHGDAITLYCEFCQYYFDWIEYEEPTFCPYCGLFCEIKQEIGG